MNTPALDIQASKNLWHWLREQQISLALTTYQTNRLFLIGCKTERGRLAVHERLFDRPMGLYWQRDTLTMGCRYQIWQLANRLPAGTTHEGGDQLYVPRVAHVTGNINVHDVVVDNQDRIVCVNTAFSCLATLDPDYSFAPIWQPPFITKLVAEDRCHLNGLALCDGEPAYVTACSQTNSAAGWRNHRLDGGIVIHVSSNEIIATGLSMPHSPRWHQNRLWLLNSGSGEFGYLEDGRFRAVAFCPGFVRGLAFHGHYALVGLSQLRSTCFGGLALEHRLAAQNQTAQSGLMIIDLNTGMVVHWLRFDSIVIELFDVAVIPGVRQPRALGLQSDDIERLMSFPGSDGMVCATPALKNTTHGNAAPVAGLPRHRTPAKAVQYQRVLHLTPENLKPYESMTAPSLQQRWAQQPPRGELFGLSAVIEGEMVGLAVAERMDTDQNPVAQLCSLYVLPAHRGQGIATRMFTELQHSLGLPLARPIND